MPTNPFTTSTRRQQILVPKELFPRKNSVQMNGDPSLTHRRPVKLPLRKHHSFHFQPSQTVAGVLKHEQFQQKHQPSTKERYKNQGPLVFKPFSEKSAFKPIIPSPKGSNDSEDGNCDAHIDPSTMPRICGTSLKRHISNVETFSSNQWQSDNEDSFKTASTNKISTGNRRKIHYADLAPLPTNSVIHHRNDRNNNNSQDDTDNADGSSGSERHTTSDSSAKSISDHLKLNQSNASTSTPTQYATLRFDEISI